METQNKTLVCKIWHKARDKGQIINITNITNMNELGEGILTINPNRGEGRTMIIDQELSVASRDLDKFKLLFNIFYPDLKHQSLNFAINYDYLLELVDKAISNRDYDF